MALLAVNLYVQSHGTQERIQQELSQRLGTTLKIRRISVTPWFGLKLTGITMPQGDEAAAGDFLRADTFRLRVRLGSIFSGRLIINEIALVNPNVVWAQNKNGKWRLPSRPIPEEPATPAQPPVNPPAAAVSGNSAAATAQTGVAPAANSKPANAEENAASGFTPEVKRVKLTGGNFHFLDMTGRPVATFEGVHFRSSLRNSNELRGDASIARISLRDRFFLNELKSPVIYDPAQLSFSKITAHAGGGQITGEFSVRPSEADSPFTAKVAFHELQADRVVTEAGGPQGMVQGRIEGRLEATGKTANPNALAGAGEIYLRDGEVRQLNLLVALGQLLQIDELNQLHLDQAEMKFHIEPDVIMVDELLLASPNIRLSANGTIDFRGRMKLESQLAISERIRGQLFGGLREHFRPIAEAGFAAVGFQVTGTLEKPKTNLMAKLVGHDLNDLGGVINSLLGGSREHRLRKKKILEAAPLPAAPTSPQATPGELETPGEPALAPDSPAPLPTP